MRNTPLKAFAKKSPIRQDIDTTLADRVYTKQKIDVDLKKRGLHTEGSLRGKTDTTPGAGANIGGGSQMINPELTQHMQKLTPTAKRMKAIRDKKAAMTEDRRKKKAESQRKRRKAKKEGKDIEGKDYDHKDHKFKLIKANRGNDCKGTKREASAKYQ